MLKLTDMGYAGKILRVDLSSGEMKPQDLDEGVVRKWVGGVGLAAKIMFDEVNPGVEWSDPENLLIWATGPLAGTDVAGAATINVVGKGPMTNLAGASQANGFMGAYMKFCGWDALVFEGRSPKLVYLLLKEGGQAELKDASHLAGLDVDEMENRLREEYGVKEHDISVFGIGPAGENLVRFACVSGDRGHVAGHNGLGAVMGAKKIKAVVAFRGPRRLKVKDPDLLKEKVREMVEFAKNFGTVYAWGTGGGFSTLHALGALPVKNYTTDIFPEHEKMSGQYLRTHFKVKSRPCYRCAIAHVKEVEVTEGPYKGFVGEEPEYEQLAAWGPQIGNTDIGATVMLGNEVDKLGMDCNEASWTIGWAMECYQKGVFSQEDTDGLDLSWGNVEAVKELLNRIARRKGKFANLLAEGVMRASQKVGGEAAEWAIYGRKGSAPRSHDHRGSTRWYELLDTCLTNTSTLESTWGGIHPKLVDLEEPTDHFSHEQVSTFNARYNGIRQFDDCLGTCRFVSPAPKLVLACFNAATGFEWTLEDAWKVGRRIVNLLRVFNLRHGLKLEDERPSTRYGSIPVDGPAEGVDIMAKWDQMVENYYQLMGWNPKTGWPLPQTLKDLDLAELIEN